MAQTQSWFFFESSTSAEGKGLLVLIMGVSLLLFIVAAWYSLLCPCYLHKQEGRFTRKQRLADLEKLPGVLQNHPSGRIPCRPLSSEGIVVRVPSPPPPVGPYQGSTLRGSRYSRYSSGLGGSQTTCVAESHATRSRALTRDIGLSRCNDEASALTEMWEGLKRPAVLPKTVSPERILGTDKQSQFADIDAQAASFNHDLTIALGRNAFQRSQLEAVNEAQHVSPFEVELQPNPVHFPPVEIEEDASMSVTDNDADSSSSAIHVVSEPSTACSMGANTDLSLDRDVWIMLPVCHDVDYMFDESFENIQMCTDQYPDLIEQDVNQGVGVVDPELVEGDNEHTSKDLSSCLQLNYETASRQSATSPATSLHSYGTDLYSASTIATSHTSSTPDVESRNSMHVDALSNPHTASSFSCPYCSSILPSQGRLNDHVNRKHNRRFHCLLCTKSFNLNSDLKRHVRSVHRYATLTSNTFQCSNQHCASPDKIWTRSDHFKRHQARCAKKGHVP